MTRWDHSVDFLIVGSGGGGLMAAIAAEESGLDTLVVEKQEMIGGSTAMSGGVMWVPNNVLMRRDDVPDSEGEALAYLESTLGAPTPTNPIERRKAYLTAGNEVVNLLTRRGVEFERAEGYSDYFAELPGGIARGRSVESKPWDARKLGAWQQKLLPGMAKYIGLVVTTNELRSIQYFNRSMKTFSVAVRVFLRTILSRALRRDLLTNGAALVGQLLRIALDDGVSIWLGSPVEEIIMEDGRVVGVRITRDGKSLSVQGRRGVLLAAGGFSHNSEMRREHSGGWVDGSLTVANPGDTGEVLQMGIGLGAQTDLMDVAWWLPSTIAPLGASTMGQSRQRPGAILVNQDGKRFANESASMSEVTMAMHACNSVPAWAITDEGYRRRYASGMGLPGRMPQQWFDNGWVKQADTLAELASVIGVDPGSLTETVAKFNVWAADGVDPEFGRGSTPLNRSLGDPAFKPNGALGPVSEAPFYAVEIHPGDAGTGGGLVADEHARVLDENGVPIAGLYATGNTTATVLGHSYFGPGASISYTMAFGYLAARHAARKC